MKDYVKYIPLSAFSLFFLKVLILPFSYPEVAVLTVSGLVLCYLEYKQNDKKLLVLEEKMDAAIKNMEERTRQFEDLRSKVNGLSLSAISRPQAR